MSFKGLFTLVLYLAVIFAMPLLGVAVSARPVGPYLDFPPRTQVFPTQPFSWPAFWLIALIAVAGVAPFLRKIASAKPLARGTESERRGFPCFGWLGLVLIGVSWVLAWNRFPWAEPVQRFTFTPLWLGYIGVVNGLAFARSGVCPLIAEMRLLAALFPLSAVIWWGFEYLNRFVGNWYYPDHLTLSAGRYALEATLPFSTVLPAVYSTAAWLATFPGLARGLEDFATPRRLGNATMVAGIALAALLLSLTAIFPELLFPLVWIAPLLLLAALQQIILGRSLLHGALASGDFRPTWICALAGLVCGVFWELWNFYSLAHWEYRIPYVDRFHVFAMPFLGYAGYLPFGILCASFVDCLRSPRSQPPQVGRSANDRANSLAMPEGGGMTPMEHRRHGADR